MADAKIPVFLFDSYIMSIHPFVSKNGCYRDRHLDPYDKVTDLHRPLRGFAQHDVLCRRGTGRGAPGTDGRVYQKVVTGFARTGPCGRSRSGDAVHRRWPGPQTETSVPICPRVLGLTPGAFLS